LHQKFLQVRLVRLCQDFQVDQMVLAILDFLLFQQFLSGQVLQLVLQDRDYLQNQEVLLHQAVLHFPYYPQGQRVPECLVTQLVRLNQLDH